MAITDPWSTDASPPEEPRHDRPNRAPEREPARDRARAHAHEPGGNEEHGPEATVLPHPTAQASTVDTDSDDGSGAANHVPEPVCASGDARAPATTGIAGGAPGWRAAAATWTAEARDSARAALDGSVWRARPPSLRDIHARAQRADWAGDSEALRLAGQAFGWISLVLTATGYGLLWLARRPLRLVIGFALAVLIVVFAL